MISLEDAKSKFNGVIRKKHNQTMIYIKSESAKYEKSLALGKEVRENQMPSKEAPDDELVL